MSGAGVLLRPATLSVLVGLALGAARVPLPPALLSALDLLGAATTPLAFIFLGMRLDLRGAWSARGPIAVVVAMKLAVMPLVAALSARTLGLHGAAAAIGTLQSAMPTALVAAIIAERAGCDARVEAEEGREGLGRRGLGLCREGHQHQGRDGGQPTCFHTGSFLFQAAKADKGQRGNTSKASALRAASPSPACSRMPAAKAIMAPLSVHKCNSG
jgi:Kef-type K+ transport system membrane component KefB